MAVLIPCLNSSGYGAAFGAADMGADVIAVHPVRVTGEMWLTSLERTDREGTWSTADNDDVRWGWVKELSILASAAAGIDKPESHPYLFPDNVTVTRLFKEKLAKYAVRIPAANGKRAQGKITVVLEQELFDIVRSPVYPHPITSAKFRDRSKTGGAVFEYNCSNVVDPADEADFTARVASTRLGRESVYATGEPTNGVRDAEVNAALSYDPTTGERLPDVFPKSGMPVGSADELTMGRGQRILITDDDTRMKWADLNLPGWNPRKYDTYLAIAVAKNYTTIPGSFADYARPGGSAREFDMNNGGLVQIGSNWFGEFAGWESMNWDQREALVDAYTLHVLGLFKTICTDTAWAQKLPAMVLDTQKWGLVPGLFTFQNWVGGEVVTVGTRRFKAPYIYEVTQTLDTNGQPAASAPTAYRPDGDVTTPTTGPTGDGTNIADGTRVRWKKHRFFQPGMSGAMYVRNSRRLSGQAEQRFNNITYPNSETIPVFEPLVAYGYPRFDAHFASRRANDNGTIDFEGGSGLSNGMAARLALMPLGALRPAYGECPNLLVVRCSSGTYMGKITDRIELSTIKIAQVAGMIAGLADQLGLLTGDLDYEKHIVPILKEFGVPYTIPKAA